MRQYRFGISIARAPDGYTIMLLTGGHAVSAALHKKLRFHPVDSFDFISLVGTFPFVVANLLVRCRKRWIATTVPVRL